MGYNARNDEIHENLERMRREREAYEDSLGIVRQFNTRLSTKKNAWFWPTIAAPLASKHHWLIIACNACDTVIDLDPVKSSPRSRCRLRAISRISSPFALRRRASVCWAVSFSGSVAILLQ